MDLQKNCKDHRSFNIIMYYVTLFKKLFFNIRLKQLGTKTHFALQPLIPFYDYYQNLAEILEMNRDNSQRNKHVSMQSNSQQSDGVES